MRGKMAEEKVENIPAVAITVQVAINPQWSVILQTHAERDLPLRDFHALMDKLAAVAGRQEAKFDLIDAQARYDADQVNFDQTVQRYHEIDARNQKDWVRQGKKGEPKLSNAEAANKANLAVTLSANKDTLKKKADNIERLRGIIEKVD